MERRDHAGTQEEQALGAHPGRIGETPPRQSSQDRRSRADAGDRPDTPPATPEELRAWLARVLGLTFTHAPLTDGHSVPFDYLKHAFFEDAPPRDCVVWANRGGGKTFLGAVATMLDLVFKPGIEVRILGGSYDQSRRMHAHLRRLFDARKRPALAALVDGRLGEGRIVMKNGATAELLAQSQTSVRGTLVQKIRCDEATSSSATCGRRPSSPRAPPAAGPSWCGAPSSA